MTTKMRQRPSQFQKVMSCLVVAGVLALCFQAAYSVLVAFSDRSHVAEQFVAVETAALFSNARMRDGAVELRALDSLGHYSKGDDPKYAFRILGANGAVLASRNDAVFSNFVAHAPFKAGFFTNWASVSSKRPFWIAGGRVHYVDGQVVYGEIATLGDPAWRRSAVFSSDVLVNRLLPLLPFLLLTIGIAGPLVHGALWPLRQVAETAGKAGFADLDSVVSSSRLSREGVAIVAALKRANSDRAEDWAAVEKDISKAVHDTRSTLALVTLQLNKLQGRPARQIEADVEQVSALIEEVSALTKKGAGRSV